MVDAQRRGLAGTLAEARGPSLGQKLSLSRGVIGRGRGGCYFSVSLQPLGVGHPVARGGQRGGGARTVPRALHFGLVGRCLFLPLSTASLLDVAPAISALVVILFIVPLPVIVVICDWWSVASARNAISLPAPVIIFVADGAGGATLLRLLRLRASGGDSGGCPAFRSVAVPGTGTTRLVVASLPLSLPLPWTDITVSARSSALVLVDIVFVLIVTIHIAAAAATAAPSVPILVALVVVLRHASHGLVRLARNVIVRCAVASFLPGTQIAAIDGRGDWGRRAVAALGCSRLHRRGPIIVSVLLFLVACARGHSHAPWDPLCSPLWGLGQSVWHIIQTLVLLHYGD